MYIDIYNYKIIFTCANTCRLDMNVPMVGITQYCTNYYLFELHVTMSMDTFELYLCQ